VAPEVQEEKQKRRKDVFREERREDGNRVRAAQGEDTDVGLGAGQGEGVPAYGRDDQERRGIKKSGQILCVSVSRNNGQSNGTGADRRHRDRLRIERLRGDVGRDAQKEHQQNGKSQKSGKETKTRTAQAVEEIRGPETTKRKNERRSYSAKHPKASHSGTETPSAVRQRSDGLHQQDGE